MNLTERYRQDVGKYTIINSQPYHGHCVGVNMDYDNYPSLSIASGHSTGVVSAAGHDSGYITTAGFVGDVMDGRHLTDVVSIRSNVATASALDAIEDRVATLESVSLMGMSVAPLRMMEMTPMTAVFQGSEYEIILADGSIIRATNFQVREIRNEGSS